MLQNYSIFNNSLDAIKQTKLLISTINAHSYNTVNEDRDFQRALKSSDVLLPDGISVVWALRLLTGEKIKKIAGADLFHYEMERINKIGGKCFFLGSSEDTLEKITKKAEVEYPNLTVYSYSPPYKKEFSAADNRAMIDAVNAVEPDVLFVGMTAPKQEKWAFRYFDELRVGHVCCIGAVFDFYAGKVNRAPEWMIEFGLEWFYRLVKEPRRLWKRYLVGNTKFILSIISEKLHVSETFNKSIPLNN